MVTTTIQRSLTERLRDRLQGRREDTEQGLALLDVLIGMAIFALIAIIALQALGQYRERAFESTALSDVKALSQEVEANFTDYQRYPTGVTINSTTYRATYALGVLPSGTTLDLASNVSKGMEMQATTKSFLVRADNTFAICLDHKSDQRIDAWAKFDSTTGQTTSGRGSNGCSAVLT